MPLTRTRPPPHAPGPAGTLTLSNVPATLTSNGANAFGGFYTAGTAL
ncbi:HtaA domain-containing protein, partial [Kitasatospora cineracea]